MIGETEPTGFCNQLFGIFAYIPVALLLGSNLFVSSIFSRVSFSQTFRDFRNEFIELKFSEFFDFNFFIRFWNKREIRVVDFEIVKRCHLSAYFSSLKRKKWLSRNDDELLFWTRESGLNLPLPSKAIVRVVNNSGMIALYDFLQSGNAIVLPSGERNRHLKSLADVYFSLRPAQHVAYIVDHVVRHLRVPFIGIHLRAERDVYESKRSFEAGLAKIAHFIRNHRCLFSRPLGLDVRPPPVYVASGLFTGNYTKTAIRDSWGFDMNQRASAVLSVLRSVGLNEVHTMASILREVFPTEKELYAEHFAMIDLFILKRSSCFIPAHVESSLSYLVQRFQSFEIGDFSGELLKEKCSDHLKHFNHWGF